MPLVAQRQHCWFDKSIFRLGLKPAALTLGKSAVSALLSVFEFCLWTPWAMQLFAVIKRRQKRSKF
jgi:hypothetical protein